MPFSSSSIIRNMELITDGDPGSVEDVRRLSVIFEWFDTSIGSSGGWVLRSESWGAVTQEFHQALIDNWNTNGREHFMTEPTSNPVPYRPNIATGFGTMSIDQWADDYGGFHPFRAGARQAALRRHQLAGRLGYQGDVTPSKIAIESELESRAQTTDGGTVDLNVWDVNATPDGAEIVLYDVGVPAAQVPAQAPVVALVKLLNGRSAVGQADITGAATAAGWGAEPGDPAHDYTFVDGVNAWTMSISSVEAPITGTSNVRLLRLNVRFTDAIGTAERLRKALDRDEIIPPGAEVEVDHGLVGKVLLLAGVRQDVKRGLPRFDGVPVLNSRIGILSTAGQAIDASRTEWHHIGDTNITVHLPRPRDYAQRSGQSRPLTVHNRGSGSVALLLNSNNVVTLRNNQTAEFRVLWHPDGSEHVIGEVPARTLSATRGDGGNIWQGGYFNYNENEFAMPIRMPAPQRVDTDAFTVPTSDTLAADEDLTAANLGRRRDTFTMAKSGELVFYKNVTWIASAGGSMPAGSKTVLHIVRNSVIIPIVLNTYGQFNNATPYELTWLWIGEVEEGDVIDPLLLYPRSSTMNIGVAQVNQAFHVARLNQDIDYQWENN